ncbi:NACHT domain-containing protein [Pedobacter alluvionis]|uniref:NACHT domain-containing protein n=1 Tax=Pedobacter alluvionis TaxID=475253 RepID=A0A497Y4Y3_9SPHI|nr:NACHT domain-containing protein [Pedobacter alluvionis]RLJ75128.1 NACHT domain-containing protein [Pedobacter alluvionis]TFB30232.1 NACHT domain-containing protein [Pedobacter alluvionis]
MIDEWVYLVNRYTIAGARSKFEDICTTLFKHKYKGECVKSVRVDIGDGGVDVFIGEIESQPIKVIQCKFFVNGIEESQKAQIRKSFKTAINSVDFQVGNWILCMPGKLSIQEHKWWAGWKNKQMKTFGLPNDCIELMDGADLIDGLKSFGLYDEAFEIEIKKEVREIHSAVVGKKFDLDEEVLSASNYIRNLKNYFSKEKLAHIERQAVQEIVAWVKRGLPGRAILEKMLVVKGKKGVGKTTVLHDVYCQLANEHEYVVLAIKCDQFYDVSLNGLSKQLFTDLTSFNELFNVLRDKGEKFVVVLDQLDALSQTLSTDRRWLQTYIKLIQELLKLPNSRIIISTRNFDLDYDADLRKFNDTQFIKQIEVGNLSETEVTDILKLLKIEAKSKLLIELLTIPYNLELFTKIPNLEQLLQKQSRISLTKLYSELWTQVMTPRELLLTDCLNAIVKRMYEQHPNLIELTYLEEFKAEISYLVSHEILVQNGNKLSFFHQSFYEYYLARWFVISDRNLIEYIFEEGQNLYIRSLIKTVIEYLREADHPKYIELYKKIIGQDQIRYHIKYLFVLELGLVEIPSQREKELVCDVLANQYGKLFLDLFNSKGWIEFFISNDLLNGNQNDVYRILYRNINHNAKLVLDHLENGKSEEKNKLIADIIPSVKNWDATLLHFFDNYFLYDENTELWYFETLKKIAPFDLEYVFEKLKPVILKTKIRTERFRFDHRFERIIDNLYQQNPSSTAKFLLSVQLEILEETKHAYYSEYSGISSELLGSYQLDNGLFYKDSEDEKSIDFYLIKYYSTCERSELKKVVQNYSSTNYVPLLVLLAKLMRDRASEFIEEIYQLLLIIETKNGLMEIDDFFQLNIRRMIAKVISLFNSAQYQRIKKLLLNITHPYEIWIYEEDGKKKFNLNIGRKKYLFLKAFPGKVLENDHELKQLYLVLERRFGHIDHNKAFDRSNSRFGAVGSPLTNADFNKFSFDAWLKSMRKIDEDFKSDDFFKGGLLEHSRSFESVVEKRPEHFCDFIGQLFNEKGISNSYISHGISALIKAKYDPEKVADLIRREIKLSLNREFTLYTTWHIKYLINTKVVTKDVKDFLIAIARSEGYRDDALNPNDPFTDFINTPRGSAIYNLFYLFDYPNYKEDVLSTIEFVIDPKNSPSTTILAGVMSQLAYLNYFDIERSFAIFQQLITQKDSHVLKYSINPAQYFNNKFHDRMGFYFDEMLLHEELYDKCYFFVNSWIFENIDDFKMYDHFMGLGQKAIECAIDVAESFLIRDGIVDQRSMRVLERCLSHTEFDLSREFSGLVLRVFKIENFGELYSFMEKYIGTVQFSNDPRYLLEFLTECSSLYPKECLDLLVKMNPPEKVDISKKAYLGDEPLVLVLSIYSRLRLEPFKYREEQKTALDCFDKLLGIPSIRYKALEAMENVLN